MHGTGAACSGLLLPLCDCDCLARRLFTFLFSTHTIFKRRRNTLCQLWQNICAQIQIMPRTGAHGRQKKTVYSVAASSEAEEDEVSIASLSTPAFEIELPRLTRTQ